MTALWVLLGIFLFFFVLFHIPLHVRIGIEESLFVYIRVLFLKIPIMPKPQKKGKKRKKKKKKSENDEASVKKEKKKEKKKPKKEEKQGKTDDKKEKPKKKMNIKALLVAVLRVLRAFFKKFGKHFKVRIYAYEVMVATGDAATTATLYGSVYGLSRMIFSILGRTKMVKVKRGAVLGVYPDFLGEAPKAHLDIDLSITLHGVFAMLLAAGFAFVKAIPSLWNEAPKEENKEKTDSETASETKQISEAENGEETQNHIKNKNGKSRKGR